MPIKKNPKKQAQLNLMMDEADYKLLKKVAVAEDRTLAYIVRKSLHDTAVRGLAKIQGQQSDIERACDR